ncbi:probable low affinity copper uptake protein 2 [Lutzomyia longipalpis]|nr:probable low affinity copper uptake protein 2 [Lutzomyia longipalpis]
MQSMAFWWDASLGQFIFPGWNVVSLGGFIGVCILLICLAVFYEILKVHHIFIRLQGLRRSHTVSPRTQCAPPSGESDTLLTEHAVVFGSPHARKVIQLCKEALVFLFHTTLGYFLMLAVMMYNGYVFLTVVSALTLAYFFLGHISMRLHMEHIRARHLTIRCSPRCPSETRSPETPHDSTPGTSGNDDGTQSTSPGSPSRNKIQVVAEEIASRI